MRRSAWILVLCSVWAGTVSAQESATLDRFAASATPADDFHLDRPDVPDHLAVGAQLHVDYANDPLVFTSESVGGTETVKVVEHQLVGNLGLSLGIADRLLVFAGLPFVFLMDGDDNPMVGGTAVAASDNPGLGDAYLGGRVLLHRNEAESFAISGQLTATFPTAGSNQRFRGDDFLSLQPELLMAFYPGSARIVINLGARVRDESEDIDSNLTFSSEATFGLGAAVPLWTGDNENQHLDLHAQAYGSTAFSALFDQDETPVEAIAGLKFFAANGMVVGAAAGPGLTRGFGSPDVRAVGMLAYKKPAPVDTDGDGLLDPNDACPLQPEDKDGFEDQNGCPDPDNDEDGVLDGPDQCPNEPESANQWEDTDGCPDEIPDTDGDGLLDNVDQCVPEPEDKDQFEDEDGCPDPDNDQDGVLDVDDRCINEPGVVHNAGCPDPDRDGDTVVDRLDNCPDEPGPPENQGCAEEQKVRISGTMIEILDKVFFRTSKAVIQRRSYALLDNVASVLNSHPEITKVRVEGHTDSRGRYKRNLKLSQDRAEAVVEYLVQQGVKSERLEAKGFGPDKPLVPDAKTKAQHAENRRVEFQIPQDVEGVMQGDSKPTEETIDR